jgi:hypothetical protein
VAIAAVALGACSFSKGDPYRDLPPAPPSEAILENINLAQFGLESYPCDLFDAATARCYRPAKWLSVREGRETLAHVHRELIAAGARFWGGSGAETKVPAPVVAGMDIGCYYDYAALDGDLRVAIIGPTGEAAPCVSDLPGDGVSQVWIIGADFDPADVYASTDMPASFTSLLLAVAGPPAVSGDVFGGPDGTVDGYYGPQLPARTEGAGVTILADTVAVTGDTIRGLVQYRGAAPIPVPPTETDPSPSPTTPETTGAAGIVVAVGTSRYAIPIVVRTGESAPFELPLPDGFTADDLKVVPGWITVNDPWRGAQLLSGPATDKACADGLRIDGEPIKDLDPGKRQACYTAFAQGTMPPGTQIFADALVAVFAEDGTVLDVIDPYLIRGDRSFAAEGRLMTDTNDLRLAWVDAAKRDGEVGLWVRYIRAKDFVLGGEADPAALAAAERERQAQAALAEDAA